MKSFIRDKKRKLLNKTKKNEIKKQMKREKKTRRHKKNRATRSRTRVYRNTSKKIKGGASNLGHYVGKPNNIPYLGYGEYQ